MVWHAHLLNPRDFLEDCIRYGRIPFWTTGLPLQAINACIDNETFDYRPTYKATDRFVTTTGLPWNDLDDPQDLMLRCPGCSQLIGVPWTTSTTADSWKAPSLGEEGIGFTDRNFIVICASCSVSTDHDSLRVQKFRADCISLLEKNIPMPGTILNSKGSFMLVPLVVSSGWYFKLRYEPELYIIE